MILKDIIVKLPKSQIKAGDGKEKGKYPLYTCSPIVNKFLDKYLIDEEAIIVSTGGNFSAHYINDKSNYSTDCFVFKCKEIELKYLYYFLISKKEDIEKMFRGAGLKHLNKNEFLELEIKEKSKKEQLEIIEFLDKIMNLINLKKDSLNICNDLIKSKYNELFGFVNDSNYQMVSLKKVAKVGSSHRVYTSEFVDSGIPFYRGTEIGQLANDITPSNCFYISEKHYIEICNDYTKPQYGDLLMPSICDKGQIWMVNTEKPFYYKDGRVLSISPNRELFDIIYFHQMMKLKTMEEYPKIGSGSTFCEFKIFLLNEMEIPLPPIEIQKEYGKFVSKIYEEKKLIINDLDILEKLFFSKLAVFF